MEGNVKEKVRKRAAQIEAFMLKTRELPSRASGFRVEKQLSLYPPTFRNFSAFFLFFSLPLSFFFSFSAKLRTKSVKIVKTDDGDAIAASKCIFTSSDGDSMRLASCSIDYAF